MNTECDQVESEEIFDHLCETLAMFDVPLHDLVEPLIETLADVLAQMSEENGPSQALMQDVCEDLVHCYLSFCASEEGSTISIQ